MVKVVDKTAIVIVQIAVYEFVVMGILIWTVCNAQRIHLDGNIILSRNYDHLIKVEYGYGVGNNLILEAGNVSGLSDGGNIILNPGESNGYAGGVYINSNGVLIAAFQITGIRLSNYVHFKRSAILTGEEKIGTGNFSAYAQFIFQNATATTISRQVPSLEL